MPGELKRNPEHAGRGVYAAQVRRATAFRKLQTNLNTGSPLGGGGRVGGGEQPFLL